MLFQPELVTRTVRNDRARANGERIPMSGGGFIVVGRPPVGAEIAINSQNGGRLALTPGAVVPFPFSELWLFHPVADAGRFQLVIWPRGVSLPSIPIPPVRDPSTWVYGANVNAPGAASNLIPAAALHSRVGVRVFNNSAALQGGPRLVRILGATLRGDTAATYDLSIFTATEPQPAPAGGATTPRSLDGRYTQFPADIQCSTFGGGFERGSLQLAQGPAGALLVGAQLVTLAPGQSVVIAAAANGVAGAVYDLSVFLDAEEVY